MAGAITGFAVVAGTDEDPNASILDDFGISSDDPGAAELKQVLQSWRRGSPKAVLNNLMACAEAIADAHHENIPYHLD